MDRQSGGVGRENRDLRMVTRSGEAIPSIGADRKSVVRAVICSHFPFEMIKRSALQNHKGYTRMRAESKMHETFVGRRHKSDPAGSRATGGTSAPGLENAKTLPIERLSSSNHLSRTTTLLRADRPRMVGSFSSECRFRVHHPRLIASLP